MVQGCCCFRLGGLLGWELMSKDVVPGDFDNVWAGHLRVWRYVDRMTCKL